MSVVGKERPAERRKGDLVVKCHPNPNKRNIVRRKGDLVVKCHLKAKSGHPLLAERRQGDLVVSQKARRPRRR